MILMLINYHVLISYLFYSYTILNYILSNFISINSSAPKTSPTS